MASSFLRGGQGQGEKSSLKRTHLPLPKIRKDETFRFSFPNSETTRRLMASLQVEGIHTPIPVWDKGEEALPLGGFHRLEAARQLNLWEVPVVVAISKSEAASLFHRVLLEHRCHAPFGLFETSRILGHLRELGIGDPPPEWLELLDLPPRRSFWEKIRDLRSLNPSLQLCLHRLGASPKQAFFFLELNPDAQALAAFLCEALRLRPVELIEILVPMEDLASREGMSLRRLFETEYRDLVQFGLSRDQKVERLRRRITEKRYPRLTQDREEVKRLLDRLALPPETSLHWDSTFEQPGLRIESLMDSEERVRLVAEGLHRGLTEGTFERIFALLGRDVGGRTPDS